MAIDLWSNIRFDPILIFHFETKYYIYVYFIHKEVTLLGHHADVYIMELSHSSNRFYSNHIIIGVNKGIK